LGGRGCVQGPERCYADREHDDGTQANCDEDAVRRASEYAAHSCSEGAIRRSSEYAAHSCSEGAVPRLSEYAADSCSEGAVPRSSDYVAGPFGEVVRRVWEASEHAPAARPRPALRTAAL
jgi:hypothetical protein